MRTPSRGVLLAGALGVALAAGARAASPHDRKFFSARHGVGVEAPPGWSLSQHTGYPSILVALLHPDGSRISVSAASTTAPETRALVEQNRRGLEAQHLVVSRVAAGPRGGLLVDARATDRDETLRQLYLVRALADDARQAVVITLVTRRDRLASASTGFDWVVAHLALEAVAGREETPDAGAR
jgi:hypothetical protein